MTTAEVLIDRNGLSGSEVLRTTGHRAFFGADTFLR